MRKYNAGINKNGFWLKEIIAVAQMLDEGNDWETIKQKIVDDNVLIISSKQRAKQIYGVLKRRLNSLPNSLVELLTLSDLESQKLINLVAIMNTELLVKEFVLTRFRDELVLGNAKIERYEIQSFFDHLQATHDDVAQWTDETINRLARVIKNYLKNAGLIIVDGDDFLVQRAIMSYQLDSMLKTEGYGAYVSALTGM